MISTTMKNHAKLLSILTAIALTLLGLFGVFGIVVAKIVASTIAVGFVLCVYFAIYEIFFSEHTGNGFD